jgi:hypothetical protein
VPASLDDIAESRKELQEKLEADEERLLDYEAVKVMTCREGKEILIQRKGNSIGVPLDKCTDLLEKLMEFL